MPPVVTPDLPTVLTTAELCVRWRCTPRTLERMARDGRIRRLKLRGGVRYPVDEILRIEGGEERALAGRCRWRRTVGVGGAACSVVWQPRRLAAGGSRGGRRRARWGCPVVR